MSYFCFIVCAACYIPDRQVSLKDKKTRRQRADDGFNCCSLRRRHATDSQLHQYSSSSLSEPQLISLTGGVTFLKGGGGGSFGKQSFSKLEKLLHSLKTDWRAERLDHTRKCTHTRTNTHTLTSSPRDKQTRT